jgi:predicted nucleotidyltransferase
MFGLKENDISVIVAILKQHRDVEEALIFGSRAKGNYADGSDVDIALKGRINFETVSRISYLLNEETVMPYKFDVLNYHTIQSEQLAAHINRVGIMFYQRSKTLA